MTAGLHISNQDTGSYPCLHTNSTHINQSMTNCPHEQATQYQYTFYTDYLLENLLNYAGWIYIFIATTVKWK